MRRTAREASVKSRRQDVTKTAEPVAGPESAAKPADSAEPAR